MISIIIPVYNIETYIETCIRSIISQSYRDLEIIIINDGSTDNSLNIIQQYAKIDSRIKIISKKNEGLSAARNAGIENSIGEYIMFVDGDDELEDNAIEKLFKSLKHYSSDISVGSISVIYESHSDLKNSDEIYYSIKYKGKYKIDDQTINNIHCSACAKLFRRDIINKQNLRFPTGLLYEDAYWHWAYLSSCNTISFISDPVYKYYRHIKSIMSSTFEYEAGYSIQHLYIVEKILHFWYTNNKLSSRYNTAINLLEKNFWLSFKFSKNST